MSDTTTMTAENKLKQLELTFEEKIQRTKELILEWYLQYKGQVYVSFSGGKDSSVLLHIARSIKGCSDIPAVFCDTGLEYPEVREHVRSIENVIWIKPKLTFKQVIEKYGYPIVSKEQAGYIYDLRHSKSVKLKEKRMNGGGKNGTTGKLSKRWRPLLDADFEITNKCCDVMKKRPMKKFEKETDKGLKTTGCDRTGCMFCMFGLHLEKNPNRFERMQKTHPKQWDYIMNKLNGRHVIDCYMACLKIKKAN